ncbi:transglycosylase domain-containing protein [Planosporangium sp. 12N6]|uniref:transglycosylase domain-containing protein n=1 Tax=Planosporangium spinosum TaxID=3402278 RepID=UPI003CF973C6
MIDEGHTVVIPGAVGAHRAGEAVGAHRAGGAGGGRRFRVRRSGTVRHLAFSRAVRRLTYVLAAVLMLITAGGAGVAGYAASVPLPADPVIDQASVLYYRDGHTVLARVGVNNRTDVPLRRVPLPVRRAVLAAEDRGFYGHAGLSARGVGRAVLANVFDGAGQGASTITQQYVRNAYLTQQRTAERKAKEAVLAVKIERRYPKDAVLERYLNTVYFGRGAYGIEAAASAYFGTTVDRLTLAQGAVLAAVIKDPTNFDPAVDAAAARDRWRYIVTTMAELGWADRAEVARLPYPTVPPRSADATAGPLGLVVDQIERELAGHGVPPRALRTAGLRVVTTLDVGAQRAALDRVAAALTGQPAQLRAALVAVEPATGAVRAYYGGPHGSGFFDDAVAARPPASTFKPLVLAEGLHQGISYRSLWNGRSPRTFPGRRGVPLVNHDGLQCPVCPLDQAMVDSLNTPFYALAEKVGPPAIRRLATAAGVAERYDGKPSLVDQPGDPEPGRTRADIALGIYPVSPADLASVYATFAAGGVRAERHLLESVAGPDGAPWYRAAPQRVRVLPAAVAADVSVVLAETVDAHGPVPGRAAAGKTGTRQFGDTDDNSDAWMAGYTPQLAAVVWIGRAEPGPIRDAAGTPIEGEGLPLTLWQGFLDAALAGQPPAALPPAAHVGSDDAGDAGRYGVLPAPQPSRTAVRPAVPDRLPGASQPPSALTAG